METERKEWELKKESELRLEVGEEQSDVIVRLDVGTAEVFGTELVKGKEYNLPKRTKLAVFTWHGCTLTVLGRPEVSYLSEETPMVMYLNLHIAVDQRRYQAEKEDKMGPRVIVCGQTDVGKTTLCRLLLNYSVRMGRKPLFVDLDIGQGSISIPGSMGITEVEHLSDVVYGLSDVVPMVFHFGHTSPSQNERLYRVLSAQLAKVYEERCRASAINKYSGCIINTCGWVDGLGYKILEYACLAFDVSLVLVIDNERLLNDIKKNLPEEVSILHLPKSGGVVARSRFYRKDSRKLSVREYFYGRGEGPGQLFPFSFDVSFDQVKIYKIGGPQEQAHLLPSGEKVKDRSLELTPVQPSIELTHHILAVSMSSDVEEDVVKTCVAGFLLVTNVDMNKELMTVLSPAPKPLPRNILLLSEVTFMDLH
jgi:polyribonucleotide 5'-hydroxyl-kinase